MASEKEFEFKFEKLTAENYHTWKFNMKMFLIGKDLWEIVNGFETLDENATAEEKRKFKKRENLALASVCLSVSSSLQIYVRSAETGKEAWDSLAKHFQQKTLSRKIQLRRKLYSAKLEKGSDMVEHINAVKTIAEHLEAIGDPIAEHDLVIILISSLNDEFNPLITALETIAEENLTWDYVRDRLIHEAEKSKSACSGNNVKDALFTNNKLNDESKRQKKGKKSKNACYYCNEKNHFARDCTKKKRDEAAKQKANLANGKAKLSEVALKTGNTENSKEWWIDSGASQHMTYERKSIEDFHKFDEPLRIQLADNSCLYSYGKGDVYLTVMNGDTKVNIVLNDVLYVPKLQNKLFSLPTVTEKGATVEFKGHSCGIKINGKAYTIGHKHGKLYKLNTVPADEACCLGKVTNQQQPLDLWHQRFGHLGYDSLKQLNDKDLVNGLQINSDGACDNKCEGCALGKQHRNSFPKKSERVTKQPLELIHSDVCGPMSTGSVGGSKYFVTFIDDYSRYTVLYTMKAKSETLSKFKEYVAYMENATGHKVQKLRTIKRLRSDNGGEYTSNEFNQYCREKGIQREFTIPHSPQQNGVSERMNRTILDLARSMLHHANLGHEFWAEAVATAVYIRNRSPTSKLKDKTPFESWFEKKPTVNHLRVFGCKAMVHVPSEKQKGKLDKRSMQCIFVGYPMDSKGYKLFNPETRKMIRSNDVLFFEDEFPKEGDSIKSDIVNELCEFYFDANDEEIKDNGPVNQPVPNQAVQRQVLDEANRRVQRERRAPDRLGVLTGDWWNLMENANIAISNEPSSYEEAMNSNKADQWRKAINEEMDSLMQNHTWDLVDLPEGKNVVGSRWVFKEKRGADGNIDRYKARLVAQGYSQKQGVDFEETFAPVAKYNSIRTVLAIANELNLDVHQMDVKTAFLNGDLDAEIYMKQPEGFINDPTKVCKLRKSIYGLKQAARLWNITIDSYLRENGYTASDADPCIYFKRIKEDGKSFLMIIAIYVDDVIIASNNLVLLKEEKKKLEREYDMVDQGEINYILGMSITRDRKSGILRINQAAYLHNVLKRFGMDECKPVSTPMETGKIFEKLPTDDPPVNLKEYQAAIGSLIYASVGTRPDISYAVGVLSQFTSHPGQEHWQGIKRVFRYLKGTLNHCLEFVASGTNKVILSAFTDADWAGDIISRKSTSGYVFQIGRSSITWRSKRQSIIALSSTEAEYVSLSQATQEAVWLRQLLNDVGFKQVMPTILYEDNQGAISLSKNPKLNSRTKHIDIKFHYVRQAVNEKTIETNYCPTEEMAADIFTKSLSKVKFEKFRIMLGVK